MAKKREENVGAKAGKEERNVTSTPLHCVPDGVTNERK